MSIPLLIYWALSLTVLVIGILALLKGAPPERLGAGLILGVVVLGRIIEIFLPSDVLPLLRLIEDGVTALGLLVIALVYASFWLGAAMLLYGALFALHAFYFVVGRPPDLMYTIVIDVCFLGVNISLGIATASSWRRKARERRLKNEAASA
jgi:hypothetical protein